MNISIIVQQMTILFIIIGIGYLSAKFNIIEKSVIPSLSKIVLNIGIPCSILSSVGNGKTMDTVLFLKHLVYYSIFLIVVAIIAVLSVKILRLKTDQKLYEFMYLFSNVGFMGLPIVEAVFGKEALIYAALFLLPSNIMLFSYGEYLMSGMKKVQWKKLVNIPVIASIAVLFISLLNIQYPLILSKCLTCMGSITTPLAMIITGVSLCDTSIMEMIKEGKLIIFTAIKMLILPIVYYYLLFIFPIDQMERYILLLMMAMPVPSNTIIYAILYNRNEKLASQATILTTLICIISIPFVFFIITL